MKLAHSNGFTPVESLKTLRLELKSADLSAIALAEGGSKKRFNYPCLAGRQARDNSSRILRRWTKLSMAMNKMVFLYVTNESIKEAKKIAKHLFNKRMINCANIFPVNAMYWREGKIADEAKTVIFKAV